MIIYTYCSKLTLIDNKNRHVLTPDHKFLPRSLLSFGASDLPGFFMTSRTFLHLSSQSSFISPREMKLFNFLLFTFSFVFAQEGSGAGSGEGSGDIGTPVDAVQSQVCSLDKNHDLIMLLRSRRL